jgi:hypothetical protein
MERNTAFVFQQYSPIPTSAFDNLASRCPPARRVRGDDLGIPSSVAGLLRIEQ